MELPIQTTLNVEGNVAKARLPLETSLRYLDGHFDKRAVLAGVVNIGWALELAEMSWSQKLIFHSIKAFKCTQLVLPPCELEMELKFFPERDELRFVSTVRGKKCASGVIHLGEPG